jgi:hypothetical protein
MWVTSQKTPDPEEQGKLPLSISSWGEIQLWWLRRENERVIKGGSSCIGVNDFSGEKRFMNSIMTSGI